MQIDFATETRMYLGLYELELHRHLKRLCARDTVSYDVGGQWGYDALILAKRSRAEVVSFEMSGIEVERMRHTIALNRGLAELVRVEHAEVGDTPGQLVLDDYAATTKIVPGFIKIDVEGAEEAVLRGARQLLSKHHPGLVVEVHSEEQEERCGHLLVGHGYTLRIVNPRRIFADHRPTRHNRWLVTV